MKLAAYCSAAFLLICFAAGFLTACGADKSREDSGDVTRVCKSVRDESDCVDKAPKRVVANHNGFPNITTGCVIAGWRYFITTRGYQDPVYVQDERCR